jgi:hypothetical protein
MKRTIVALTLLLAAACTDRGSATEAALDSLPQAGRPALDHAHAAYLTGDYLGMSLALKEVLSNPPVDADVRDNALALLEKAYEVTGGRIPADWTLPRGLTRLGLGQTRVEEPGETGFGASLSGFIDDPARIQVLQVSHGGEVVLDKAKNHWKVDPPDEDGQLYFSVEAPEVRPLEPGLYDVHLELAGVPPVDGWVIVGDLVARAAPRIRAPGLDAVVDDRNPTLSFEDFYSPGYRPFENRTLYLAVWPQGGRAGWSLWTAEPGFTEVVVGKDRRGTPQAALEPGRHWINVIFTEKRRFGPMGLGRASSTHQPFRVR